MTTPIPRDLQNGVLRAITRHESNRAQVPDPAKWQMNGWERTEYRDQILDMFALVCAIAKAHVGNKHVLEECLIACNAFGPLLASPPDACNAAYEFHVLCETWRAALARAGFPIIEDGLK